MSEPTEQDKLLALLTAVQNANETAFSEFYDLLVGRFHGLASKILQNSADAEEAVCDAFTQIWQQAKSYQIEKGSVIAWCMVIVRSRSLDSLRKRNTQAQKISQASEFIEELSCDQDEPEKLLQLFQKNSRIGNVLKELSPIQHQLLALSFFKGLTHNEIAETMQMPLGTVKSNIRRTLEHLQSRRVAARLL